MKQYRRKPRREDTSETLTVAQYTPGAPLDDLRAVAALAMQGEVAECSLPSGPVLVAAYLDVPDEHPARTAYTVVRAAHWLCFSSAYGSLVSDTTRGIAQWYDEVPG